jgi:DNA-binding transcriptional MerR regulator
MAGQYRIGEFADLSGVSTKTLRFYDEVGLLRPASIDPRTRYRYYLPQQLEELASILALKDIGLTLTGVRNIMKKTGSRQDRREMLHELKKTVEDSIQTATDSLNWISAALKELDESEQPVPVIVKRRPAVLIASVRSRLQDYSQVGDLQEQLLNALPVQSIGTLRGVLWHSCEATGGIEGEMFVALRQRVPARSFYEVKQLPPATLACAYTGVEDDWPAYNAIGRWMQARGYCLAGPKRELHLDQLLEVQFPLKSA